MVEIYKTVSRVAPTDATVLIEGETGTGKELVARMIHRYSARAKQPFVPVDCASIAPSLLESELFGAMRGAFTGADRDRVGVFEAANRGTVFLDEIGEIEMNFQASLLRFLQEREIRPVGASRSKEVDVRVIAATNRDLQRMVDEGKFREDLWYRLNVVRIVMPPLRERRDDIPLLARFFVNKYNERYDRDVKLMDSGVKALQDYTWPGNVRQLQHMIERLTILADRIDGEAGRGRADRHGVARTAGGDAGRRRRGADPPRAGGHRRQQEQGRADPGHRAQDAVPQAGTDEAVIDIHSHILHGIDDGAKTFEDSVAMVQMAAAAGTTDIVASPHANQKYAFDPRIVRGAEISELQAAVGDTPQIYYGCDFHLTTENIEDAVRAPEKYSINHKGYLLVEFSDFYIPKTTPEILARLMRAHLRPIITHPERNQLLQTRIQDLAEWVAQGAMLAGDRAVLHGPLRPHGQADQ